MPLVNNVRIGKLQNRFINCQTIQFSLALMVNLQGFCVTLSTVKIPVFKAWEKRLRLLTEILIFRYVCFTG